MSRLVLIVELDFEYENNKNGTDGLDYSTK